MFGMSKQSEPVARKSVTLPISMWEAIADIRFSERIASEADLVRQLLQEALDMRKKRAARKRE